MAGRSSLIIKICSLLMAFLFALSASFQLNDPVNLVNGLGKSTKITRSLSKFALWLGLFLFIKVIFEDIKVVDGVSVIWSLDMRERVVREKIGTGLVIGSMALQLNLSPSGGGRKPAKHLEYGMAIVVGIGYGLSFLFCLFYQKEMRF